MVTHLVYAFLELDGNKLKSDDPNIQKFTNLKTKNPGLKTMAAVGGWGACAGFSEMARTDKSRKAFANNAVTFLNQHGFDGLDIDWGLYRKLYLTKILFYFIDIILFFSEFPCENDKQNFVQLLNELYGKFKIAGLLLSVAVGATQTRINESYLISEIHPNVDFINLMTYDFHGFWGKPTTTGMNAPLYGDSGLNVDACVQLWLNNGVPPAKLIMGVPFYGRSFTLNSTSQNGVGAPADLAGKPGPITKEAGVLAYNEVSV